MTDLDIKNTMSLHGKIIEARTRTGNGAAAFGQGKRSSSTRLKTALYVAAALVLAAGSALLIYESSSLAGILTRWTGGARSQDRTADAAAAKDDPFTSNAAGLGAKACARTYGALGKVLTAGAQFMVQTEASTGKADMRGLQGLVGMRFGNQGGAAAGVVFAAPNDGQCEGQMVRVVPFAQDCAAAARLLPKDSRPLPELSGVAMYALATGGQAMLLPAASGCVAISILRSIP